MQYNLFPVALDLRGRRCVVVGGGAVGERRVRSFIEAGAEVCVVAPDVTAALAAAVERGEAQHIAARFEPAHLDGVFLVVAATDDGMVNDAVACAARQQGVLLNQAAESEGGDFVTMAAVRRGGLLLGITTGGAGPAVTARLRKRLENEFGPEWTAYIDLMGEIRETVKRTIPSASERQAALRRLAEDGSIRERLAAGDAYGARKAAMACLS